MSGLQDVLRAALDSDPASRAAPAPPPAPVALPEAREKLLRHLDAAYNLARWLCGDEHDAQDIVQESFLRAVRFIDQCRDDEPRTWLLKIVRNTCSSWHTRRRASSATDAMLESVASPASTDPGRAFDRTERATDVRRAIESLPQDFREAIVLREIEGLSYKEVALVVGVPIGTVMSRLSRARDRLKDLLVEYRGEVSR
jgi:RNA polymerase sigma-70 factor (ECF subfamily)